MIKDKVVKFETGLGTGYMVFNADTDNHKLEFVTNPVQTINAVGESVFLDNTDTPEVLTAKWHGYKYTCITYCYCGNVKTLGGLVCKECQSWNNLNR